MLFGSPVRPDAAGTPINLILNKHFSVELRGRALMIHVSRRIGIALETTFTFGESFDPRRLRDESWGLFEPPL